ncbi:hypothetical protein O7599_27865 [Streptomyces sp. WMMC500]|uniref:hypothetical protein n=1 Tax=Streptomyces sp. WMMC500 TaxID=3015154 RepID=UPI00248C8857|nr:hypothetical protein [Streptomyces sp. WMMC500]WBB59362.1 hypothetical protein O7599_27865 [Streptomyces sp. WMMC500]
MPLDNDPEAQLDPPKPEDQVAHKLMRKIERLAKRLITVDFEGADGLWGFQRDLLALQWEIQKQIRAEKQEVRIRKKDSEALTSLKWARWQSRRLGDSFAWVILGMDRKLLYALSENAPVPVSQEGHGSRGLLAVSEYLAGQGWGFPLIHDITDTLRIGDVTFVRFEGESRSVCTVEVKTRSLGPDSDEEGSALWKYQVAISFMESRDAELNITVKVPSESEQRPGRPDRRISRQSKRMAKAITWQQAEGRKIVDIDGRPTLTASLESSSSSKWKMLRRVIRKSRTDGYASEFIDGAFMIAAFYENYGITAETVRDDRIRKDMEAFAKLNQSNFSNTLEIASIPTDVTRGAQLFRPYYLYPIPQRAIFDLLYGRLAIIVGVNAGGIAGALKDHGHNVQISEETTPPSRAIILSDVVAIEGQPYRVELHDLGVPIQEAIYEFKGVEFVAEFTDSIRDHHDLMMEHITTASQSELEGQ